MYKVIKSFMDLQDDNFVYNVGDVFPRKGTKVTIARYEELESKRNKRGEALIARVEIKDVSESEPVVEVKEKKSRKVKKNA